MSATARSYRELTGAGSARKARAAARKVRTAAPARTARREGAGFGSGAEGTEREGREQQRRAVAYGRARGRL